MKQILYSTIVCLFFAHHLFAQDNILRRIIDLPAPPPFSLADDADETEQPKRDVEFYNKENVPPDNAPIEDLLDFWTRQNFMTAGHPNKIEPSGKTLERLIKSVDENPENLTNILTHIPINEETAEIVKKIFDSGGINIDEEWREKVGSWLKFNSKYYSDELFAEARNAKDHKTYGYVIKEKELRILAKVDWQKAESLLERLAEDNANPVTSHFAKRLIYEHAISEGDNSKIEKYRSEFQKIVEDKNAASRLRDASLDALVENQDWRGSDEWYISLFEDGTLLKLEFGESMVALPLNSIVRNNPDKWIPIVAKFVGNTNPAIHNSAVQALVQFQNRQARKDALEPLIPWISNPDWAKASTDGRLRLIQSMGNIDMPESVLPLLWAVENDEYYANWAADSLVKYKDPRAIPALRIGLEKARREEDRAYFYRALIASGGFRVEEKLAAIESYAEKISTPEGYKDVEERYYFRYDELLPLPVSIGKYLANQSEPSEGLILQAIEREKILLKEKPEVAKILSVIMQKWKGRLVDLEMLRKISEGKADIDTIVGALARRVDLKQRVLNDLYTMRGKIGLASGISACLLEDENEILTAFRSQDVETQISALACARLIRADLPVREVGIYLNSQNKLLALAAERYLESEDSPDARSLVWAKHPGEALILGARDSFNPEDVFESRFDSPLQKLFSSVGGAYFSGDETEFNKFEEELRKEVLSDDKLAEIYAFGMHKIKVYADKIVYRWNLDAARYRERILKKDEFDAFHRGVIENNIYDRPPVRGYCHHDCASGEFVILNRNGGRRLYMQTAFHKLSPYDLLFTRLQSADAKLVYRLSEKLSGLEVLLADKNYSPKAIWKNSDDFRVLVEDEAKKREIEISTEELNQADYKNEELDYKEKELRRFERNTQREFEHFEWRKFENGKISSLTSEPAEIPFLREKLSFPALNDLNSNERVWETKTGNYEVRAGGYHIGGLWKVNRSSQIEFKTGRYASPIVSGNWVVAAKAERDWSGPNFVFRINLQTGREFKVELPPADNFDPVALVPSHSKILLFRARDDYGYSKAKDNPSPESPEYYLLEANSGKTMRIEGEFRPLIQQTFRPLQPTGKPNEFWAAVYDKSKNQTEIGRYNARDFLFKSILQIPEIALDSMDIWVDEGESKLYFIYQANFYGESHLLSLPLPVK